MDLNGVVDSNYLVALAQKTAGETISPGWSLCLNVNEAVWTPGQPAPGCVEPSDSDYARVVLTGNSNSTISSGTVATVGWPTAAFNFSGDAGSFTVYGWFILDLDWSSDSPAIGQQLSAPQPIPASGGNLYLVPQLSLYDLGADTNF